MEMKQISETTLKITISMDDLEERGMELKDFLIPQEKTEEFFYAVMDELDLPDNFKDSGMLSFRVTPRKDRLDVFVTKSDLNKDLNFEDLADLGDISQMTPEDFFRSLEQSMREKGDVNAHEKLEKSRRSWRTWLMLPWLSKQIVRKLLSLMSRQSHLIMFTMFLILLLFETLFALLR